MMSVSPKGLSYSLNFGKGILTLNCTSPDFWKINLNLALQLMEADMLYLPYFFLSQNLSIGEYC